jgi:hypothetical protein
LAICRHPLQIDRNQIQKHALPLKYFTGTATSANGLLCRVQGARLSWPILPGLKNLPRSGSVPMTRSEAIAIVTATLPGLDDEQLPATGLQRPVKCTVPGNINKE